MRLLRDIAKNERGMVLFVCLTLLSVLTAVAVGALVSLGNDFKISANLRSGTAAFYLADSGIEWAKQQISRTITNPPALQNGNHSSPTGSFAVFFSAPAKVTALTARTDVRSIGRAGNASQVIHARISKEYELADAALAVRGHNHGLKFEGETFFISGRNHDADGMPVDGPKSRSAMSVAEPELAAEVNANLNMLQIELIVGGNEATAIRRSERMPSSMLALLAGELCGAPSAQNVAVAMSGVTLRDRLWGSSDSLELRCINGARDGGDAVTLSGNVSGAGILVVRDAELVLSGSFRWQGWVLVSGDNVGVRVEGEQSKEILGALVINETAGESAAVPPTLDLRGGVRILYSHAALAAAASLIPPPALAASYAALPFSITQDYWRGVGP